MSVSNRSTNGHRFVFHSLEVTASERYYVADEPGVIPYHPPSPPLCPAVRLMPSSAYPSPISINGPPIRLSHTAEHSTGQIGQYSEHLPTIPSDADSDQRDAHVSSPPTLSSGPVRSPVLVRPPPLSQIQQPTLPPRSPSPVVKLKAGDALHWHHLSKHGEIPGVQEDPRARGRGFRQRLSPGAISKNDELNNDTSLNVTGMAVVCGR